MLTWIMSNLATIIVCLVVLLFMALAVRSLIRDRKAGVHSCGYNCPGCGGSCPSMQNKSKKAPAGASKNA